MSETMIERVAKAIMKRRFYDCEPDMYGNDLDLFFKQVDRDHCIDALDEARAAIEAMKDPSIEMRSAAQQAFIRTEQNQLTAMWNAMIDEALNEQ